jgi:glycerophosphoryl diester phosphodiesterase
MKRPILLGHRGARASHQVLENTLESFELCLQHGCDGFEFDVRRSADGVAVICHDPAVRGLTIERTLAADLELPTLTEVLSGFGGRAFLDIELKVGGLEAQVNSLLGEVRPSKGYLVSSFLPQVLTALSTLDPPLPLGFLCEDLAELNRWLTMPVEWVVPRVDLVDSKLIDSIHAAGKKVMSWTVNQADEMRTLVEWGVDAIITDDTVLGAKALRAL